MKTFLKIIFQNKVFYDKIIMKKNLVLRGSYDKKNIVVYNYNVNIFFNVLWRRFLFNK